MVEGGKMIVCLLKRRSTILLFTFLLLVIAGCSAKSNPAEDMYVHLEKAVELENVFAQQQEPLVNDEQKEHELYEEMIMLGLSEIEQIKKLANEAIGYANKRQEKMDAEKESLDEAYQEFVQIETFIEEIEQGEVKDKAQEMFDAMDQRYHTYQTLHEKYSQSIELDKELYDMLQDEELLVDQLEEQINTINQAYEEVMGMKDEFNKYTNEYNELKRSFYEVAEIEVTFEEGS